MRSAAGFGESAVESLVENLAPESLACREIRGYGEWFLRFTPARHIAFGVVTQGSCQIADEAGEPVPLCHGDFLVTAPSDGWAIAGPGQHFHNLLPNPHSVRPALREVGAMDEPLTACIDAGYASLPAGQDYLQSWIGHGLVIRDEAAQKVKSTLRCLKEEVGTTAGASGSIQRRLLQVLLLQAYQAESLKLGKNIRDWQVVEAKGVLTALRAMQSQPEVEWTVATLAAAAFMSRSVFAMRFEQMLGLPPMCYLRERRMMRAKTALRNGSAVKHVAALAGFRSDKAFITAFHRRFGQTPDSFRRSQGIQQNRTLDDHSGTLDNPRSNAEPI